MDDRKTFRGVFPVAPTTFTDNESLDLNSQRRVLDCMIDQGVDGICILANYSEQFLLSDQERDILIDTCLDHIAGRISVIVTCSHYCTRIVIERAKRAADKGANMIMLMPPYHGSTLKADEKLAHEHFAKISKHTNLPIMIQDAPISGVNLSAECLAKMATNIPNVSYFKIEVSNTANKLRSLIDLGGESVLGPFDGEESITLFPDLEAGATGTMPSAMYPDLIKPIVDNYQAREYALSLEQYNQLLPLINFENRQCGLQGTKVIMKAGGVIKSDKVRHPLTKMPTPNQNRILELAKRYDMIALRWGK